MNPFFLILCGGSLLAVMYIKGYLGFADLFGMAVAAKPNALVTKPSSRDAFAKAVKMAAEEAQEEIAGRMADEMRTKVVQTHMAAFTGSGPSAQPAPESASPAAPAAS